MNDLYLIGNGFDLAHKLKTSYTEFILWYLSQLVHRIFPDNFYEDKLLKIDKRFKTNSLKEYSSISELLNGCSENHILIEFKHPFFQYIVVSHSEFKWVDIEYEYYKAIVKVYEELEKELFFNLDDVRNQIIELNDCLDAIKEKLVEYLSTIDTSSIRENEYIKTILFEGTGAEGNGKGGEKLFLCFNYTKTIELYTRQYFSNENHLIYVHGELGEILDSIVFGYGDEMDPLYEKIEHLNENRFLDNIKSFSYFKTSSYLELIRFIGSRPFTVKILGHSCGLSDRILLNTIFEHENCEKIKIYYHQKSQFENDFFIKTQEISRHFKASGKGIMRKRIWPFDKSTPLVPYDV